MSLEMFSLNYFTIPAGVSNSPLCAINIFPRTLSSNCVFLSFLHCCTHTFTFKKDACFIVSWVNVVLRCIFSLFVLELFVNGQLDSVANGGFRRITILLKTDLRVEIDTEKVLLIEGQRISGLDRYISITVGR